MTLNNKQDVEKLQKLQNRALRLCYNVYNPRDMNVARLHELASVDMLQKRRMLQLMNMMYENRVNMNYERAVTRNTRQTDKYTFETNIVNLELYSKSPYYIGSKIWNNLPRHVQDLSTKKAYKHAIYDLV